MSSSLLKSLASAVRAQKCEAGAVSVLNLYFVVGLAIFSGVAIDTANLVSARTHLQVAADVAAHAAMYSRKTMSADEAKTEAIRFAEANMPPARFGNVLRTDNIHFGSYDQSAKQFTVDESSVEAVWVEVDRLTENANPVSSFLLHLVGFWDFDVRTNAVFVSNPAPCLDEGFFANDRIDMQSNNEFWNRFCLHSNDRIEFNNNNFFEADDGVVVSVPTYEDLVIPGSGFQQNPGLQQALRTGGPYDLDVNALIDEVIAGMTDPSSNHYRSFVTNPTPVSWPAASAGSGSNGNGKKKNGNGGGNGGGNSNSAFNPESLTPGRVHNVTCSGGTLDVGAGTYTDVVVITDCNFDMANGVILENATFISTSTDSNGVLKSPQGFQIGRDDNCAPGGGAQLILKGSMKVAAKMKLFGGQIISGGDVKFAAQGNGFGGASVIADGEIDGTSNSVMGLCGDGMDDFFEAQAFGSPRLAG